MIPPDLSPTLPLNTLNLGESKGLCTIECKRITNLFEPGTRQRTNMGTTVQTARSRSHTIEPPINHPIIVSRSCLNLRNPSFRSGTGCHSLYSCLSATWAHSVLFSHTKICAIDSAAKQCRRLWQIASLHWEQGTFDNGDQNASDAKVSNRASDIPEVVARGPQLVAETYCSNAKVCRSHSLYTWCIHILCYRSYSGPPSTNHPLTPYIA